MSEGRIFPSGQFSLPRLPASLAKSRRSAGCRHQGCAWKCKSKCLCHNLHGRCSSDKGTCATAWACIAFCPVELLFINSPRSNFALYIPSCSRVSISGPAFMVPPGTNTEGMFTLASPIRFPGTPLSQLERYTPASKGVAFAWIQSY